jgi:hypothetical protein
LLTPAIGINLNLNEQEDPLHDRFTMKREAEERKFSWRYRDIRFLHFLRLLCCDQRPIVLKTFWESQRHGLGAKFPQYTLREMNCASHMSRTMRWDLAFEASMKSTALQARAKFMEDTAQFQQHNPTDWERRSRRAWW